MSHNNIANFLSKIKNASQRNFLTVSMPLTKQTLNLSDTFYKENLIRGYKIYNESGVNAMIILLLKYNNGQPLILKLNYLKNKLKYHSLNNHQIFSEKFVPKSKKLVYILSTPNGFMSLAQARRLKIGGILICSIELF